MTLRVYLVNTHARESIATHIPMTSHSVPIHTSPNAPYSTPQHKIVTAVVCVYVCVYVCVCVCVCVCMCVRALCVCVCVRARVFTRGSPECCRWPWQAGSTPASTHQFQVSIVCVCLCVCMFVRQRKERSDEGMRHRCRTNGSPESLCVCVRQRMEHSAEWMWHMWRTNEYDTGAERMGLLCKWMGILRFNGSPVCLCVCVCLCDKGRSTALNECGTCAERMGLPSPCVCVCLCDKGRSIALGLLCKWMGILRWNGSHVMRWLDVYTYIHAGSNRRMCKWTRLTCKRMGLVCRINGSHVQVNMSHMKMNGSHMKMNESHMKMNGFVMETNGSQMQN